MFIFLSIYSWAINSEHNTLYPEVVKTINVQHLLLSFFYLPERFLLVHKFYIDILHLYKYYYIFVV